jgi:outer membrane lipoprotein SlyB
MFRKTIVTASFALMLGLGGCAPPSDESKMEEEATAEAEAAKAAEEAKEEAKEEAREERADAAAAAKPRPKPRPAEPAPPPPPAVCNECGVVASVTPVKEKGSGSGAGAVIGAIAGGVIGHQFGGGRGKDVATAGGAVLGGVAGHEVEKRARSTTYYSVAVNMENGTTQTVNVPDPAGISAGTRVRVVGGNIQIR